MVHLVQIQQQLLIRLQRQVHPRKYDKQSETYFLTSFIDTLMVTVLPARPGRGLFAVCEQHFVVLYDVALNKMKRADGHGLRNQVGVETVATVEGHEKAESPEVVRLIMFLSLLSNKSLL